MPVEARGAFFRARQAPDVMSGAPKGVRDAKSDVAGGSGDEDLHGGGLSFRPGDDVDGRNGDESPEKLAEIARGIGVPEARRHIFLCCDQTKPKCSERDRSNAAWDYLKARLKELGLSTSGRVQRNKANCLGSAPAAPSPSSIPRASWYRACDPPVLERIIQEHLVGGRPVEEYAFVTRAASRRRRRIREPSRRRSCGARPSSRPFCAPRRRFISPGRTSSQSRSCSSAGPWASGRRRRRGRGGRRSGGT